MKHMEVIIMFDDERTNEMNNNENTPRNDCDNIERDDVNEEKIQNHFYDEYNGNNSDNIGDKDEKNEGMTLNSQLDEKESYYKETVKKKKGSFKKVVALCAVVSFFGGTGIGAGFSAANTFIGNYQGGTSSGNSVAASSETSGGENTSNGSAHFISSNDSDAAVAVINDVYPAIVNINTNISGTTNYFGMNIPYQGTGAGSGVIFSEDDQYVYVVTNNHVIDEATNITISVTGVESIPAEVVGTASANDLAVIKSLKSDLEAANVDYKVAKFGDSDKLNVGQSVIAIGNALGEGKSVTGGMISVLNKTLDVEGTTLNVIQTSAPINNGNSGGALVDYDGEVIGINTAKTSTTVAEAMGYAIPSNTVMEIAQEILVEGTQPKPYIGIMGTNVTGDVANLYKLPVGVLVVQVTEGTPAETAGLEAGDIITAINDKTVMNMDDLTEEISQLNIGDKANLNVVRGNEAVTITVEIADANAES